MNLFVKLFEIGVAYATSTLNPLTTTTLGTAIDTVNSTWYDYFLVMLGHYWPFVVAVAVILIVWGFGRRAMHGLN